MSATAFKMVVEKLHSTETNRIRQTIYQHNTGSGTYVRTCFAGTWGDWQQQVTVREVTNVNGKAIIYSDGTMICTAKRQFNNVDCTTSFGVLFRSDVLNLGNYPVTFISEPTLNIQLSGNYTGLLGAVRSKSNSAVGSVYFIRPDSVSGTEFNIEIIAIGKWK